MVVYLSGFETDRQIELGGSHCVASLTESRFFFIARNDECSSFYPYKLCWIEIAENAWKIGWALGPHLLYLWLIALALDIEVTVAQLLAI